MDINKRILIIILYRLFPLIYTKIILFNEKNNQPVLTKKDIKYLISHILDYLAFMPNLEVALQEKIITVFQQKTFFTFENTFIYL
jgi:hypothetical protein